MFVRCLQHHFAMTSHARQMYMLWMDTMLVHPFFRRVKSQNDAQKLSKLHYKGGNARAKIGKKHGQLSNPS